MVAPRLRLDPPDDPDGAWWVELQLVDQLDAGRWCSAADIWNQTPLAVDLAGDARQLDVLESTARDAGVAIAAAVPQLAALATDQQPEAAALELAEVGPFLDEAPDALARLGVDIIGPERLVRARVAVRGVAGDATDDASRGPASVPLDRRAVVEWDVVVDGGHGCRALDAASLGRAEVAGSGLLHTGGRWVRIASDELRAARRRLDACRASATAVSPTELLALSAELEAHATSGIATSLRGLDGWTASLLDGLGDGRLEEAPEPERFVGTLRHYQRRGLAWLRLLAELGLGGCLADDMGLGKTATTLAHLCGRPGPHLVVCPLSVVRNWHGECARFTPSLATHVHHGNTRSRGEALCRIGHHDIVITTYGLLTRDAVALSGVHWATVVLDEAQAVKNSSTGAARAVRALRSRQTVALTGTPVENRLHDLWSILDAVNPGMLGSKHSFRARFAGPIERHGDPTAAARLRRLTEPLVLRRSKSDKALVPDLPDKIEQLAWAALSEEQAVLYQAVVDRLLVDADREQGMRRRGIVLAAITRLKQICNHPAHALADGSRLVGRSGKLARFDDIVAGIRDEGGQALVFTQFRAMGKLLRQHLHERFDLSVPFLEGSVGAAGRAAMVERFQSAHDPLLLVSVRAGGTGLNLTAASHVVHYDRWWNPAVEDQATDRAWRIGQRSTVVVHKLVTQGTIEERIAAVMDEKRAVADAAVGRGEAWIGELSTDELARLVRLEHGSGRTGSDR